MVGLFLRVFLFHVQARKEIIRKIDKTVEKLVHSKEADTAGNGVLGRLLEEESLPNESMADFIINLMFAGNETTAKTMLFAVYFLTHCPKAMTQILVISRFGDNRLLPLGSLCLFTLCK